MDNGIINIISHIKDVYDDEVFYNFQRVKNILNDLTPGLAPERIQAKNFIEMNGYYMLKHAGESYDAVRNRLIDNYMSTYKVDSSTATWIVDVFGAVLGYNKRMPVTRTIDEDVSRVLGTYGEYMKESNPRVAHAPNESPTPPVAVKEAAPLPARVQVLRRNMGSGGAAYLTGSEAASFMSISADYHTVALKRDGTVLATGYNNEGQCEVSGWRDIVSVAAGSFYTVGLRADGTLTAAGLNDYGQCNVSNWRSIVAVSAGARHTVGLTKSGTVVATGQNKHGECNVSRWRNIKAVVAGYRCTYGIKKDGTVLLCGDANGDYDVSGLDNVVSIANVSIRGSLALRSDGTIVKISRSMPGSFAKWKDIKAIAATPDCFIGLSSDGTVKMLAYYWKSTGVECGTYDWIDIVSIAAGRYHVVGIKSDGSVEAVMLHTHKALDKGQCCVSRWTDIQV